MNLSLTHQVGRLLLEFFGVLGATGVVVLIARRGTRRRASVSTVAATALSAFALLAAVSNANLDRRLLGDAQRVRETARSGIDYCFAEDGVADREPFVEWARRQMPPHAVYVLEQASGALEPDGWCLTLALEPALPAGPGHPSPQYEIAYGAIPAAWQPLIAHHDSSVRLFARGFGIRKLGSS